MEIKGRELARWAGVKDSTMVIDLNKLGDKKKLFKIIIVEWDDYDIVLTGDSEGVVARGVIDGKLVLEIIKNGRTQECSDGIWRPIFEIHNILSGCYWEHYVDGKGVNKLKDQATEHYLTHDGVVDESNLYINEHHIRRFDHIFSILWGWLKKNSGYYDN